MILQDMTDMQLDIELQKGMNEYEAGRVHSVEETFSKMKPTLE